MLRLPNLLSPPNRAEPPQPFVLSLAHPRRVCPSVRAEPPQPFVLSLSKHKRLRALGLATESVHPSTLRHAQDRQAQGERMCVHTATLKAASRAFLNACPAYCLYQHPCNAGSRILAAISTPARETRCTSRAHPAAPVAGQPHLSGCVPPRQCRRRCVASLPHPCRAS